MWERFSYYGMRALLVLYMVQSLFVNADQGATIYGFETFRAMLESVYGPLSHQAMSSHVYGIYTGLVYFTPFFGGLLADRYLGQSRAIYIGAILMAIGHLVMASESWFFLALLLLILGNGFFKPNLSAQVGSLYSAEDPRRDRAFTIYYMGVNLGATLAPFVCGTLGQVYGWHYGFASAGVGMLIGLTIYYFGRGYLPNSSSLAMPLHGSATNEDTPVSPRIFALVFLCIINILFWGVYEQQGNTLQLWADHHVDWMIAGFLVPSTWLQSFNPIMIICFAPLLGLLWQWQNRRGKEPNSVLKMAIGCFLCAAGYFAMAGLAQAITDGSKINPLLIAGSVALFTLGELYLSPIGLSLVTKLAPVRMVSMLMGLWFLSSFFGNYLAGAIGAYYDRMSQTNFFIMVAMMAVAGAVLFLAAYRPLKKVIPAG
jgi:POT family proton-dependent oligopeptide transporter